MNMNNQTITKLALVAVTAMLAGVNANATLIGYSVTGTTDTIGKSGGVNGDTITLAANNSSSINLTANGATVEGLLNNITWKIRSAVTDTSGDLLSRAISISLTAGSQTLSQDANLNVNWWSGNQTLTIASSSPVIFSWTSSGTAYMLKIVGEALTLNANDSQNCGDYNQATGQIKGLFTLTSTANSPQTGAVPEPSTVVAGALLLLPFGVSTMRILRRKQAAK
jgi:hypothetical protein